jgi:hypothetical protein
MFGYYSTSSYVGMVFLQQADILLVDQKIGHKPVDQKKRWKERTTWWVAIIVVDFELC